MDGDGERDKIWDTLRSTGDIIFINCCETNYRTKLVCSVFVFLLDIWNQRGKCDDLQTRYNYSAYL